VQICSKMGKILLFLVIAFSLSFSSIESSVYAIPTNGKTISGSVDLWGHNRLKGSSNIHNFSNTGTETTIEKPKVAETYKVSTIKEFVAKTNYAISNRISSININYMGSEKVDDVPSFLNNTVLTLIKTPGNDYEKNLLRSSEYTITDLTSNAFNVTYTFEYIETEKQEDQVKAKVKEVLGQIITANMTEGQRVRAINSYICKKLSYDTTLTNYSAYEGILGNGKTVCQGYALLAYRMLTDAGLEARIITGTAFTRNASGNHAWNMVKVGGSWYHLDITWNDPLPDINGRVTETYSLRSDAQMLLNHSWDITNYFVASKVFERATDVIVPEVSPYLLES